MGSTKISKLTIGTAVKRSAKSIVHSINTYNIDPYLLLGKSKESKPTSIIDNKENEVKSQKDQHAVKPVTTHQTRLVMDEKNHEDNEFVTLSKVKEDPAAIDTSKVGTVNIDSQFVEKKTTQKDENLDYHESNASIVEKLNCNIDGADKAPASMLLSLQHQVKTMNLILTEKETKLTKSKSTVHSPSLAKSPTQNSAEKSPCRHTTTYNREEAREYIRKQQAKRKSEMASKSPDQNEIIKTRLNALKQTQRELVRANVQKRNKKELGGLKASRSEPALRQDDDVPKSDQGEQNQCQNFILALLYSNVNRQTKQ